MIVLEDIVSIPEILSNVLSSCKTEIEWAVYGKILPSGYIAVSYNGNIPSIKIGDGIHMWSELPFFNGGGGRVPKPMPYSGGKIAELDSADKASYDRETGIWLNKSGPENMRLIGSTHFYNEEENSVCMGRLGEPFSIGYIDIQEPPEYTLYAVYALKKNTMSSNYITYNISWAYNSSYTLDIMNRATANNYAGIKINGTYREHNTSLDDYLCVTVSRTSKAIKYYLNGILIFDVSNSTSYRANKITFYSLKYNNDPLPVNPPSYIFETEYNIKYFSLHNKAHTAAEIRKNAAWLSEHCGLS